MTTLEKIAGIIEGVVGKEAAEKFGPAATFAELCADSFDHIEIVLECEREFDIDLDQDDLDLVVNMGNLVALIRQDAAEATVLVYVLGVATGIVATLVIMGSGKRRSARDAMARPYGDIPMMPREPFTERRVPDAILECDGPVRFKRRPF